MVAATKYVSLDDMAVLAEAGVAVVGENRAQDMEAKHARYGDAFRWHFIGHLQSRKAAIVNEVCELCHSLDSESAARRLAIPALVEVNLSGEPTKSGVTPERLPAFLDLYPDVRGLMTMPPADGRSRVVAAVFPAAAGARRRPWFVGVVDGNESGLRRRRRGGCDPGAGGLSPLVGVTSSQQCPSPTSGTAPSCTSGSPKRRTGSRTGTSPTRSCSRPTPSGRISAASLTGAAGATSTTTGPTPSRPRTRGRASFARRRSPVGFAASRAFPDRARCASTSCSRAASTTPSRSPTGSRRACRSSSTCRARTRSSRSA